MQKLEGLLGLCCRANQITLGAELALKEIKAGRAALALVDACASEGTKKKMTDACAYRRVPVRILPEGTLSRACGKEGRMAAAVKAGPLCRQITSLLTPPDETGEASYTI